MVNMSYCRFENTYKGLEECMDYINNNSFSASESKYRQKLIKLCIEIAEDFKEESEEEI